LADDEEISIQTVTPSDIEAAERADNPVAAQASRGFSLEAS
jgi:hypothetical protein